LGKVVRVERRNEEGTERMGVAAVIERYDIIRGEAARAESELGLPSERGGGGIG